MASAERIHSETEERSGSPRVRKQNRRLFTCLSRSRAFRSDISAICVFFLLALAVHLIIFSFDHSPGFHFGDSGSYLATALINWIPPDRSFTYGFLLRPLVVGTHSLLPVLLLQLLVSSFASAITGMLLVRYWAASPLLGFVITFVAAIEPLNLMLQRFIMTESVATFVFALLVWVAVRFLRRSSIVYLVLLPVLSVVLVSLRYSFLPLLLCLPALLPFLAPALRPYRAHKIALLVNIALGICLSQTLLYGYLHLYGSLSHKPPALSSSDGFFLLSDVAPLVKPEDFPIASQRTQLFQRITIPFTERHQRRYHRWVPGGLCEEILRLEHGNEVAANSLARQTGVRAIRRNPLGFLNLVFLTYRDFLNYAEMRWALRLDRGYYVSPTDQDVNMIRNWFGIDASDRQFHVLTKRWESIAEPWCWLMAILPFLYATLLWMNRRRSSCLDLLILFLSLEVLIMAVVPVEIANPRYLVPLPWLSVLMLGIMLNFFTGKQNAVSGTQQFSL